MGRWSIPKEGCYAVRNVIIIGGFVSYFSYEKTINTEPKGGGKKKRNVDKKQIQSDWLEEAIMLEALIRLYIQLESLE